jgi:acetolactate synthase-1/2/3 large subunit
VLGLGLTDVCFACFGVDPGPIDAVGVAAACGLHAVRVGDIDKFRRVVEEFVENPAPLYVDVQVPHMIDYLPPVPAWAPGVDGNRECPVY